MCRTVEELLASSQVGSRRRYGPHYVALRRITEAAARQAFVSIGGRPHRHHPHYFVLGESPWFAGLYDEPLEVRIPLADLPAEVTSFTWTDSITALGLGRHLGVPQPDEDWKRRLYQLDPAMAAARTTTTGQHHTRATTPVCSTATSRSSSGLTNPPPSTGEGSACDAADTR